MGLYVAKARDFHGRCTAYQCFGRVSDGGNFVLRSPFAASSWDWMRKILPVRSAPLRSASLKSAPVRSASLRSAPLRSVPMRYAPLKLAPRRSASLRLAPIRSAPLSSFFLCWTSARTSELVRRSRTLTSRWCAVTSSSRRASGLLCVRRSVSVSARLSSLWSGWADGSLSASVRYQSSSWRLRMIGNTSNICFAIRGVCCQSCPPKVT